MYQYEEEDYMTEWRLNDKSELKFAAIAVGTGKNSKKVRRGSEYSPVTTNHY